ncbi:MAG: hypothetical protein EP330_13655 [Deltaproteobacteria bacterium]|nr:MAG: hypothetical protein EP330_13655 [Deltaproteobacteria bacterium]
MLTTLLALLATPAFAQDAPLRVVVVPKVTADGNTRDAGPLEAWVHGALKDAGHRVVDLDASLQAQAFALSDAVAAGQVPEALSVLNADAAWAVQLSCEKDTAGHSQAMGLTWYCTMTRKVVRISQGDTAYAETAEWNDVFGTNPGQALFGGNVKKRAPGVLAADITAWSKEFAPDGPWDADLKISGLTERSQATALAALLGELPGVESARMATFNTTLSQFLLHGQGAAALADLPDMIESDGGLGLRVTHVSDRLIHAEVDLGRVHRRKVGVQVELPKAAPKSEAALVAERGPSIVRAAMGNLRWLEVADVSKDAPEAAPWFAKVSLAQAEGSWLVTASLVGDDGELLAATGRDSDPLVALDAAVRGLDESFLAAAADPSKRLGLGLPEDLGDGLMQKTVRIEAAELSPLFPARAREAKELGLGRLTVINAGTDPLTDVSIAIEVDGQVLASREMSDLEADASGEVALRLDNLPSVDPNAAHTLPLVATVSYKQGGRYGRSRAYSSLVVHRLNTLDWNNTASVAAFVDPADSAVRDLATAALGGDLPEAPTRSIGRAAAIHARVWGDPLRYVPDPVQTSFADSIDEVQHPRQTLSRLSGDCDDLTVLLASLYESVGLSTVILTTPGHVLLGVDSGLRAGGEVLVGLPSERFVQVDGALFVPVEATALTADFASAWEKGAELVAKAESFEALRVREAWRDYPAVSVTAGEPKVTVRDIDLAPVFAKLPALDVPKPPKTAPPLAGGALSWASGSRNKGLQISAEACEQGVGEACFNLAVMLMATAAPEDEAQIQEQLETALTLLPRDAMEMLLDQWGGGRADEQGSDEASAEAETRRRLEAVLQKARDKQEQLEEQGVTDVPIETSAMAGRRGAPATEEEALAPMFFYSRIGE